MSRWIHVKIFMSMPVVKHVKSFIEKSFKYHFQETGNNISRYLVTEVVTTLLKFWEKNLIWNCKICSKKKSIQMIQNLQRLWNSFTNPVWILVRVIARLIQTVKLLCVNSYFVYSDISFFHRNNWRTERGAFVKTFGSTGRMASVDGWHVELRTLWLGWGDKNEKMTNHFLISLNHHQ